MNHLLDPLAAFAPALTDLTLQLSLLVSVVLVLRAMLGRRLSPSWRAALWSIVLLRLLWPTLPDRLWAWRPTPTTSRQLIVEPIEPPITAETQADQPKLVVQKLPPMPTLQSIAAAAPMRSSVAPALVAAWLGGVLVCLAHAAITQLRLQRLLQRLPRLNDARVLQNLATCSQALRVGPLRTIESEPHISPAVAGLFRPTLIVPRGLADRLTEEQLGLVLAHELLHVRRHDVLWRWIAGAVVALQWFNPLVHLARRCFLIDCELATDAAVLRSGDAGVRHAYGEALLSIAGWTRLRLATGAISIFGPSSVGTRIDALVRPMRPSRLVGGVAVLIAGCTLVPERSTPSSAADRSLITRYYDVQDLLSDDAAVATAAPVSTATATTRPEAPSAVAELIAKCRKLLAQGDYLHADDALQEVLHRDPHNAYARHALPLVRQRLSMPADRARQMSSDLFTDLLPNESYDSSATQPSTAEGPGIIVEERSPTVPATKPWLGVDLHRDAAFDRSAPLSQRLIATIQQRVDPASWKTRGGSSGEIATLNGQLIITQTAANQRAVQSLLDTLRHSRDSTVLIETRFLQSQAVADSLRQVLGHSPAMPFAGLISSDQLERLMQLDQRTDGATMLIAPKLLVSNGQRADIAVTTDTPFVSSLTTFRDKAHTMAAFQPTVDTFTSGVSLVCQAFISEDRQSITLTSWPQVTWLRQLAQRPVYVPTTNPAGTSELAYYHEPIAENASLELTAIVPDGATYAIAYQPTLTPDESGQAPPEPIVVLLTLHIQPPATMQK